MYLFLLLVAVPVIEIALFIEIGGWIGTWPTVAIVILTALVGSILLRKQGLHAMQSVQTRLAAGENPGRLLADGAMILVAGALLLTPGFFTDGVGFLLLIPGMRLVLFNFLASRIKFQSIHVQSTGPDGTTRHDAWGEARFGGRGHTVDGDYEDVTPQDPRPRNPDGTPRLD